MQNQKLKTALRANATFSMASGLAMLLFCNSISLWMGISKPMVLCIIGIGLLLFALSIIWIAQPEDISENKTKIIIWQDWLWVIGSAVIIVFQLLGLYAFGYFIIGAVAVVVAVFAVLQQRYLG